LRCLIVDDSAGFLQAARAFLEQEGITVVGVASTGEAAIRRVSELCPDVTQLERLGIPAPLAEAAADHVDWHQVATLVRRGCPPQIALRIVR
jgi:DNA-binding NarL/FixJ family response regulator